MAINIKPKPVKCVYCGKLIEPELDGYSWYWPTLAPATFIVQPDGSYKQIKEKGPAHHDCQQHAELWERIHELEKRIKE